MLGKLEDARTHLEDVIKSMKESPVPDIAALQFSTHALASYLHIVDGVATILGAALADYPIEDVQNGLNVLKRSSHLMTQALNDLCHGTHTFRPEVAREEVVMAKITGRFCEFYRQRAVRKHVELEFDVLAATSTVISDRILIGVVLDNLFSIALDRVCPHSRILVLVEEEMESVKITLGELRIHGELNEDCSIRMAVARQTAARIGACVEVGKRESDGVFTFVVPKAPPKTD